MKSHPPLPWRSNASSSLTISFAAVERGTGQVPRLTCGTIVGAGKSGRHEGKLFGTLSGAMAWSVSLAANEISLLPLVRLPAPQNERRDHAEETSDVKEVPSERNELHTDQPNVTSASDKEIRPPANRERARQIKKEK